MTDAGVHENGDFAADDEARLRAAGGSQPVEDEELYHPEGYPFLVRTDFDHPEQWREVTQLVRAAQADFITYLAIVDDPQWREADPGDLLAAFTSANLLVIADTEALSGPNLPLLMVGVQDEERQQMRVLARYATSVEVNLTLGNNDWLEYADRLDADGVYRG